MTESAIDRALPARETTVGYLLRLSRPRFWLYLAGPVVVGVAYAADVPSELFAPAALALFAYFLVPANVFLYGVNDVFDADIDTENPKKEGPEVRYRRDRLVPGLVALSGLAGLAFLPALPTAGAAAMVAFLLLSIEYSAPPLRFKTTPFLDSISNGLYVLPGVVAYVAVAGVAPPTAAVAAGWLWTMGMHTFSAIPDIESDRAAGIDTTATVLGEFRTYVYCGLCWLAAAVAFGTVHPFFAAVLWIYPVFVGGVALSNVDVDRAYWWFPALNTAAGAALTLGALWVMLYG
ncbi:MAG: prenyltransferase [Natronomonas sp.]|jgi:4-hydroxybenzoate polyprenyltransferase|uniref:prenyltransferase n=1 Tax=Natronomonas sp. TaxID=2184060 RepID=UPI00286FF92B|nr:prenyltransferase [Natronomonas sp.]MDR9381255.1 prenyltransferase [Natronomonas sp.]MDR9429653.1 prenyltransferase [Natronomonas sp.]